ncbi:MAG TPA: metallophosphoesterase [Thermoleophilaceae bacterium]|nr:metallophosphoesterase [Thermoleophilaceae bacterium]
MRPMRSAIVSDLHLGLLSEIDVVRLPEVRERLVGAVADADHVVLLGDLLELRERGAAEALELARPLFRELGEATAGRQVTVVPGNHDHSLAGPWLDRLGLDGAGVSTEGRWEVGPDDGVLGRLAGHLPDTRVSVAYPGFWLRPDVYATHGHYLDLPLTVPRIESVAASVMARVTGRGRNRRLAADYEAALGPMYAFLAGLGEGMSETGRRRAGRVSRNVWERANGRSRVGGLLISRAAIPGAVAALNRLGVGPLEAAITGEDLRRGGLTAMREVAEGLVPAATHVIFGHTHRPGPLPGDDESEWTTATGTRLWNSGSWCHEPAFVGPPGDPGPYWPGTVIRLEEPGPPRVENVLSEMTLPAPPL